MNRRGMLLAALLVALLAVAALAPAAAMAEEPEKIPIDVDHFPGAYFWNHVLDKYDKDGDGYLSQDEIEDVKEIDLPNKHHRPDGYQVFYGAQDAELRLERAAEAGRVWLREAGDTGML